MINKRGPNWNCTQASSHCATLMCTIDFQLVKGVNKLTWSHTNIFIKIVIHTPSRPKT